MENIDMSSLHVLVIEDDRFMRKMLGRTLINLGIKKIEEASNGVEGLEKVEKFGNDLDLIICDLDMPEMNGMGFVFRLRNFPEVSNPLVPVLIVSGHSEIENIDLAKKLGISGFLDKPVTGNLLEEGIINALQKPMIEPVPIEK